MTITSVPQNPRHKSRLHLATTLIAMSLASAPVLADKKKAAIAKPAAEESKAEESKKEKPKPKAPTGALVGVDMVKMVPMVQTIPLIGRVVSKQAGPVASQVSGPIKVLKVQVGDRVSAGQVLSEMDGEAQRAAFALREAELAQANADVEARKTTVSLAQSELTRAKQLRRKRVISESDYVSRQQTVAKAKAELAQAEAGVLRAKVNLAIANRGLKEINLRAPYNGVVTLKHTSPGAWVNPGSPVVTLVNDEAVEIEADVPSSRIGALKIGNPVRIDVRGKPLMTNIRAIVPNENPSSKTRVVRFALSADHSAQLAQNQGVTVNIPSTVTKDVLSVHKDAVIRSAYGPIVYIVENGVANMKPVQLGEPVGSRFVVLGGVPDKALAVIRGNERIAPGAPVMIKPAK